MVKIHGRNMPNWKTNGKDGVQGYWLKSLASFHPRIITLDNLWKDSFVPKRPGKGQ